jgi:hypothetical protein
LTGINSPVPTGAGIPALGKVEEVQMDTEQVKLWIGLVAVVVSVLSAYVSFRTSRRLGSADYKAFESFKADTARLLATLRAIIHKAALSTQGGNPFDITTERKDVNEFLSTTTAFAFHAWVGEKSKRAFESGQQGEPWRVFFLQLVDLSRASTALEMGRIAANLELLFEDLSKEDLAKIASYLTNLPTGIKRLFEGREYDPIVKAFVDLYARKSP